MSIAKKLSVIAENEQKVFDGGYSKSENDFWNGVQDFGKRTNYEYAFIRWGTEYIRPKHKVVPKSSSRNFYVFSYCPNLKKIEAKYFDFSAFEPTESAGTSSNYYTFTLCSALQEIEDVGIQAGGYYGTFSDCPKLETVAVMRCTKNGVYTAPFRNCTALKNITIEGEIGNNITFQHSPLLTIESLKSIITALYDYSGTDSEHTYTLTLNKACISTLNANGASSPNGNTWVEYIDDKKWNLTLA